MYFCSLTEVAIQIAKDIDSDKFCSMTIKEAEEWLQTTTSPAGDKFRQFLKKTWPQMSTRIRCSVHYLGHGSQTSCEAVTESGWCKETGS
ncbi:hypothetical protein CEXT_365311 [Caerostris extrusa]|uniref:Uncharacterized protein n=1 Tax=Caerostris extrusa TaxID=172846 RepID=A0AAV4MJ70_CAEEX|nr:hypothetical protein CEXT_365311 [Caerostris extrusa]